MRSWTEPTRRLPLRWGAYVDRYVLGLALILGGGLGLQGANPRILPLLLAGTVMHAAGWIILPAGGGRRVLGAIVGTAQIWLLLIGPPAVWTLVLPYLAWLAVRHRPWRSYVTVLFPLATGILMPQLVIEYQFQPVALPIALAVVVASAWIARAIASSAPPRTVDAAAPQANTPPPGPAPSEPEEHFR
jgi:hypothetical protein